MNKRFENMEFYGRKISQMNQDEVKLIMNDILLINSMELMRQGKTESMESIGLPLQLGTMETYIMLSSMRLKILGEILGIDGLPEEMILTISETTDYSFRDFLINVMEKIKNGDFDFDDMLGQFGRNFDVNLCLN